jgi:uncharacterized membrane protein YsdA (DUF1294 family)
MASRRAVRGQRRASPLRRAAILFGAAALAFVLVLVLVLDLPFYPAWIAALSVVTFVAYGYDKRQAQTGGFRTPELALHGLALAGGFPGGWAGRAYFHHKTQHRSFLIVLIVATVLHAGIIYWLYIA